MTRRRGIVQVGMSFIDTLTCGIGAMIMLWMAQVNRIEPLPKFGGSGIRFRIAIGAGVRGQLPDLALRVMRVKREDVVPLAPTDISPDFGLIIQPHEDGASEYYIDFTQGVTFTDNDQLLVYLYDLRGRPFEEPVSLSAQRFGNPHDPPQMPQNVGPSRNLSGREPVFVIPLADVIGQSGVMRWRLAGRKNP
jgi:hypothetical protein